MNNRHKRDEYVYKVVSFKMSNKQLSNLFYCLIMSGATDIKTHGIGIYEYSRKQNTYNGCEAMFKFHPSFTPLFEEYGFILKDPIKLTVNYHERT